MAFLIVFMVSSLIGIGVYGIFITLLRWYQGYGLEIVDIFVGSILIFFGACALYGLFM